MLILQIYKKNVCIVNSKPTIIHHILYPFTLFHLYPLSPFTPLTLYTFNPLRPLRPLPHHSITPLLLSIFQPLPFRFSFFTFQFSIFNFQFSIFTFQFFLCVPAKPSGFPLYLCSLHLRPAPQIPSPLPFPLPIPVPVPRSRSQRMPLQSLTRKCCCYKWRYRENLCCH